MKLNLDTKDSLILDTYIETKYININLADIIQECFKLGRIGLDKTYLEQGYDEKATLFLTMMDMIEMNMEDEDNQFICEEHILNNIHKQNIREYTNNEYFLKIKPIPYENKNYKLTYLTYKPFQVFPLDEIIIDESFNEETLIGYFDKEFKYLAILKNDVIWMSLNPNEINTMKPYIEKANGNVLIGGLGLGYVAYMMSLKKCVNKITIVEKDFEVIKIFKDHIFKFFDEKDKIEIIQDDFIKFIKNNDVLQSYNYIFADLWHTPEDGLPLFIKIKEIEKHHGKNIDCWLEKSMTSYLRRCALSVFEENKLGYSDSDYINESSIFDKIINKIYNKLKDLNITDIKQINNILSDKWLLDIIG